MPPLMPAALLKPEGRSEEWVEKAIRKSESITADEALKLKLLIMLLPISKTFSPN